jgi:hypothetical protein
VFIIMSYSLFREPVTAKTLICLLLSVIILCVQLFMK